MNIGIADIIENKYIEIKRQFTSSLLKTISAFANYHDGEIIIGISDNGEVIGLHNKSISSLRLSIENSINDSFSPRPHFEMFEKLIDNKTILVLKIYKGEYIPYYYNNKAYKRSDTSTVEVDRTELNRLILEGQNFTYEELQSSSQNLYFSYLEKKFREIKKINSLSIDVLKSLELIKNDKYINSALLLADNNSASNSKIILVKYTQSYMDILDKLELVNMSIVEQFDKCVDFFHKHISVKEIISGAYRETIEEIPIVAYREAIANAILHRDYMAKGDIKVEFFDDRIEIISPGGLPLGISEKEYIEGRLSIMRNRIIADIFLRLGAIEKLATGIRRIKEHYVGSAKQPGFDVAENSIKVILPKKVAVKKLEIERHNLKLLNVDEKKIIVSIKQNTEISRKQAESIINKGKTYTYKVLKGLMDKGYIFSIGKGKNTVYLLINVKIIKE